ncbi:MAG TPA: HD domain-containing protein [Clostridiales bacterium]|nr:HD domain-containing protein [Clostridiales bacterium]
MKVNLPEEVVHVLHTLNNGGYEGYVVGGAVRDSLLGITAHDFDIATNALPHQVKKLFPNTVDTGIKHGTVTVIVGHRHVEVTTYRAEGEYRDYRRPNQVKFISSLKEDLSRRDFTVNAIAYSPATGYIDFFNGMKHLSERNIKTVGDANARFREDSLRMMRAVRFACQLNFQLDDTVLSAIRDNAHLILNISKERIRDELDKILLLGAQKGILLLRDTGLLKLILPEVHALQSPQNFTCPGYDIFMHTVNTTQYTDNQLALKLAALFHDIGKPHCSTVDGSGMRHFDDHAQVSARMAGGILKRLKYDNGTAKRVIAVIKFHDIECTDDSKRIKKLLRLMGREIFVDVIKLKRAGILSQDTKYRRRRLEKLEHMIEAYENIIKKDECFSLRQLAVDGNDLLTLGFKQGRRIGQVLNKLLDAVIEDNGLNKRDILMRMAREYLD